MNKTRIGIIGGTGYAGGELLRLLPAHPGVAVTLVTSATQAGREISDVYPTLPGYGRQVLRPYRREEMIAECDLVFLAKPQPNSFAAARDLFDRVKIIDLSGDFRFPDAAVFRRWYGREHEAPELQPASVYGLPELNAAQIKTARLLANPGCYPTAVLLALLPAARAGLLAASLSVSAVSGFSGAGRTPSPNSMAWSVVDNIRPYRVGVHPHAGEMELLLNRVAAEPLQVSFVPQVAGFERGIAAVIFARPASGAFDEEQLRALYGDFCRRAPFVRLCRPGEFPEIKSVLGTNFCDLGLAVTADGTLVIVSVIDNLVKGAAGQAIQNLNLMTGRPEHTGLAPAPDPAG